VVVVAHRPSAIAGVDLLLMMNQGRVQAFGPKDEVLARVLQRDGTYSREYRRSRARLSNAISGFSAQQFLVDVAEGKRSLEDIPKTKTQPFRTRVSRHTR